VQKQNTEHALMTDWGWHWQVIAACTNQGHRTPIWRESGHFKHNHHHFNRVSYVYHCPSCELFYSIYRYYCSIVHMVAFVNLLLKTRADWSDEWNA